MHDGLSKQEQVEVIHYKSLSLVVKHRIDCLLNKVLALLVFSQSVISRVCPEQYNQILLLHRRESSYESFICGVFLQHFNYSMLFRGEVNLCARPDEVDNCT